MTGVETRSVSRDSLFLLAEIRVEQSDEINRVRVRNLSNGGMMAEGNMRVQRGNRLKVQLRNVGAVFGTVAWVQDDRFGIAFDEEVDSQSVRKTPDEPTGAPADVIARTSVHKAPPQPDPRNLRKV